MAAASVAGTAHSAEAATLLSQGKTATASSVENASFPASAAVDGNTGTGGTQTLNVTGTGRYVRM